MIQLIHVPKFTAALEEFAKPKVIRLLACAFQNVQSKLILAARSAPTEMKHGAQTVMSIVNVACAIPAMLVANQPN